MLKYVRGWIELEITGAAPEICLNRLAARDIPFWRIQYTDGFTVRLRVYRAHWSRVETEISRSLCVGKVLCVRGFRQTFFGLKKRPVLLIGLTFALLLAALAQTRIWFIRVEGNERVPTARILQILREEGVCFGAWGPGLDSQYLKNRMLNRIPELRWLSVNRSGCIASVPVAERTETFPGEEDGGPANVVAARDGVITELRVTNGYAAVGTGEAVRAGTLLVSGLADWTTHTSATRASAEVYADTLRSVRSVLPEKYGEKTYTGREEVCKTLIVLNFRRKISGNSGIFGTSCDRISETELLTLPGGFALPAALETVTLREYIVTRKALTSEEAERILRSRAESGVRSELTAGEIRSTEITIEQEGEAFFCRAEIGCNELISRTVPILLPGEEEHNGENHQRRTNRTIDHRLRLLR